MKPPDAKLFIRIPPSQLLYLPPVSGKLLPPAVPFLDIQPPLLRNTVGCGSNKQSKRGHSEHPQVQYSNSTGVHHAVSELHCMGWTG